MRKIIPYKTSRNALKALDNGGRFYNLLTNANDGSVTSAELAKVAGVFGEKQKMTLFLEMALMELDEYARKSVYASLTDSLKRTLSKHKIQHLVPSEAQEIGIKAQNAIVTGIPRFVTEKTDFNGFIMVPITSGKTTTMMMIPIIDQYDVYELRDESSSEEFLIAHARGSNKLPESKIRCGGILKELKSDKKGKGNTRLYLEAYYYSII